MPKYFSQHDEEKYILEAVGDQPGRFLEIGAYDGYTNSNTLALVKRDWSGTMVEPALGPFLCLLERYGARSDMTLIHAAVGLEAGLQRWWDSQDQVSTLHEHIRAQWKDAVFRPSFYIPVITFADLFKAAPGPYDFVSIDVEGGSAALCLEYLSELGYNPRCFCVEHDNKIAELESAAKDLGYGKLYQSNENLVFGR